MKFFANKYLAKLGQPLRSFSRWMNLSLFDLFLVALGNFVMVFALVNIHVPSNITEGGVLGLNILIQKTIGGEPALIAMILDFSLYGLGIGLLGGGFLKKSIYSTVLFSSFYALWGKIGPVLPSLADQPLLAALLGGLLLGSGCGLVVTRGSAAGGDDCYALIMEKHTRLSLAQAYFSSDTTILLLSFLVYLPLENVFYSFLTTLVSSFVIGQFEVHLPAPQMPAAEPQMAHAES